MRAIKSVLLSLLSFVSSPSESGDWKRKIHTSISHQLTSIITCPEYFEGNLRGIVVVQFQVSEDCRIGWVRVYTHNKMLNEHLTRQLTGKKILMSSPDFSKIHRIKIHFQPSK